MRLFPLLVSALAVSASATSANFEFPESDTSLLTAADAWPSQVPFWPQYPSRTVQVLTGTWQFGFSAQGEDPTSIAYGDIQTPNTTSVPFSFDVCPPGVLGPRGNAYFRSSHTCTPGHISLVKFYAVNFYARLFVDGVDVGNHTAGGYVPFEMVTPPCSSTGTRELLLVTNNQQNKTLSPTNTDGDFYFYSGIIRPVIVTELPSANGQYWIDHLEPISTDYIRGLIDVKVVLGGNWEAANGQVHLTTAVNGNAIGQSTSYPVVNGSAMISNVPVPNTVLWTPGTNNLNALFTVQVSEGYVNDSIVTRTGLRVLGIDVNTSRITINGKIVNMKGYNRHTMWPDVGAAVTPDQEATDMSLIVGVHANYVRGAHYPQSQSWLDLCDENGIMIWEETLGPGTSVDNMNDPWFMDNHLAAVTSMVTHSFHHPSVILHAFFNEGPSNDPQACVGYARSAETIKNLVGNPPMRLVTWANNHVTGDVCIAYEDVISFNSYPGWYSNPRNLTYAQIYWGEQVEWVSDNWPEKPLTISETGGAGIFEWINASYPFPGLFWSQTYQTNLLSTLATAITSNPRVSGLTLWQGFDTKANDQSTASCGQCVYENTGGYPTGNLSIPWTCAYISNATVECGRPYGENHKGSVDFWRRPKLIYPIMAGIYGNISTHYEG